MRQSSVRLKEELHKVVDIIFAPFNYLIDRGYRNSLQISWSNSILIFDEAHNLVQRYRSSPIQIFTNNFHYGVKLLYGTAGFREDASILSSTVVIFLPN
ncbi:uncharacterized protein LOC131600218 [Vicia villosa]|uniref:uncharacterized protein LOC131600218 n=1 Tax=Vicia villosa TaxID=3911 RepID=UPI00273CC5AF|nr:uncharacterized protein LOC131600218 [Vicia villosa]